MSDKNTIDTMISNVSLIKASAGAGKTYELMNRLSDCIGEGVEPEGLLATTFTVAAAAELQSRIRKKLIGSGKPELAARVFDGLIGTVNGVCGRLLAEYAIEAGLSPAVEVLPEEDAAAIFKAATEGVIACKANDIERLAAHLNLNPLKKNQYGRTYDWKDDVRDIVNIARSNGIDREHLAESAKWSKETLKSLFDAKIPLSLAGIKERIAHIADYSARGVTTINNGVTPVKNFLNSPTWKNAAQLAKCKHAIRRDPDFPIATLHEIGRQVFHSQELYDDMCKMIDWIFGCAGEALDAYSRYKETFGLIDFTDQETRVLELLRTNENFQQLMRERLTQVMVDEFQDTSPIQLALFLKLNACSKLGSIWVGDPKQAIYGFRGADPELMDAVVNAIPPGSQSTLSESWRSRKNLVELSNAIFTRAFAEVGMDPQDVQLRIPDETKRDRTKTEGGAIDVWTLVGGALKAMAAGIAAMIRDEKVRPGDICVLLRTNLQCRELATALRQWDIPASASTGKLAETTECRLVMAAYRYCINKKDTVALATLFALYGSAAGCIERLREARGAFSRTAGDQRPEMWYASGLDKEERAFLDKLDKPADATPLEVLDHVIAALELDRRIAAMPDPERCMSNVDELRKLCAAYMDRARVDRTAATPAGFVAFFAGANADQAVGTGVNTVKVMTYHKSKGLGFPVVILGALEGKEFDNAVFDIRATSTQDFDPADPLKGRRIRYWPFPFSCGRGRFDALNELQQDNACCRAVREREIKENRRLFYVGVTRAADRLVFAVDGDREGSGTGWLDTLAKAPCIFFRDGKVIVGNGENDDENKSFPATMRTFSAPDPEDIERLPYPAAFAEPPAPAPAGSRAPAHRAPSGEECGNGAAEPFAEWEFRSVTKHAKDKCDRLGNAVHNFFSMPRDRQDSAAARRLLDSWGVADCIDPDTLVGYAAKLFEVLDGKFPGAKISCEVPITFRDDAGTLYQGSVDMLLELADGNYAIVDHKTHPSDDRDYAAKCAGQLRLYRAAVEEATKKKVVKTIIHLPLAGKCYEVR